ALLQRNHLADRLTLIVMVEEPNPFGVDAGKRTGSEGFGSAPDEDLLVVGDDPARDETLLGVPNLDGGLVGQVDDLAVRHAWTPATRGQISRSVGAARRLRAPAGDPPPSSLRSGS